jgi:K+-sensing histidine kinase KdpD
VRTGKPSSPASTPAAVSETACAPGLVLQPEFLELLVHDLRTPLNVMTLSLRLLNKAVPKNDRETHGDLGLIEQNVKNIEAMLAALCDYMQLFHPGAPMDRTEFSPARVVEEILDARPSQEPRVILEAGSLDTGRLALDRTLARMAIAHGLSNAVAAAGDSPVRIRLAGQADVCRIEIAVDQPPPSTVKPGALSASEFERFLGNVKERRGIDLGIVAKVSERFGGSARLEVQDGRASLLILEWPRERA